MFQKYTKGIFYGDNPLNYTLTVFTLQASLVCLSTAFLRFLLIPLGETSFIPQVLAGLLWGPSFLGKVANIRKWIFASKPFYSSEAISLFGTMIFLFLMGVKTDPSLVMRTGKKTWAIGLCCCLLPHVFSIPYVFILRHILSPETDVYKSLYVIAAFSSSISFQVTVSLLEDFKLLNSEVGRLAVSSSMVSGIVSAMWQSFILTRKQRNAHNIRGRGSPMMAISMIVMVLIILCILRPIMLWMIRKTPKGKPIKESYIVSIYVMVLGCSLFGEFIGRHYVFGPLILGLAVPEGPPLGSALVERLDTLISGLYMPMFFFAASARFKPDLVDFYSFKIVQPLAITSFFGKIVGTVLPSLYCDMPLTDGVSFGLIMSAQGITHLLHLQNLHYYHIIDDKSYAQMVIAMIWLTAASNPIVKYLYDPSKIYLSIAKRRTVEHSPTGVVLPLMACIHTEENTPPMINFLEMSNSTVESPIWFHVIHLLKLKGRAIPVLIDHQQNSRSIPLHSDVSNNIINAFKSYEQQKPDKVVVKVYTSISPYETMHDEICLQAAHKQACMLIVPFHRQFRRSGVIDLPNPIRTLNRHLLRTAPCSVGILVERGSLISNNALTSTSFYSVGVLFIEGPDDREALAYAMRMAEHPNVKVSVIRLTETRRKVRQFLNRDPDTEILHKFLVNYSQIKRHDYKEEVVRDSVEMIGIIRTFEGCYDLILVGRRHEGESSLFYGMTEWIDYPELGSVADMLVSSDSTFDGSVLVVQQQNKVGANFVHHDFHQENSVSTQERASMDVQPHKMVMPVV
ncbi:unnamed protein product [Sphenostylis stenocarpa]|uniref:Cation/H+ exchanger domain-containing protein n=1 Tax=Sphenostylis stenocarpa TaxID=92480 RepID=A0AA86TJS5_9FABA|nr:unnamed protein product [Sphenostylis stenocarpa]